jgi:hypothetical protein
MAISTLIIVLGLFYIDLEDFSEDGTSMSKHVGLDSCHEFFMICTVFYFINCICWLLY